METWLDFVVAFLLGAWFLALWINRKKNQMSLLPDFTVQKIQGEWFVTNTVRAYSVEDREKVIAILLAEIDELDAGTSYDVG